MLGLRGEAYTACYCQEAQLRAAAAAVCARVREQDARGHAIDARPSKTQEQAERATRATDASVTHKTRRSVVTNSLFGLGAPELVVILGLGAFVLGPDKLASMAKDFGKVAGELKDVPKEFKEGLEEGEAAKAARVLEEAPKEEESA